MATPHSQRSVAKMKTRLSADVDVDELPIRALIECLEDAIGTPVQSAVKREDEQEFALRNGQNLMFCEDAGRKLKSALSEDERFDDFWIRIEHHDAEHLDDRHEHPICTSDSPTDRHPVAAGQGTRKRNTPGARRRSLGQPQA